MRYAASLFCAKSRRYINLREFAAEFSVLFFVIVTTCYFLVYPSFVFFAFPKFYTPHRDLENSFLLHYSADSTPLQIKQIANNRPKRRTYNNNNASLQSFACENRGANGSMNKFEAKLVRKQEEVTNKTKNKQSEHSHCNFP